MTTPAPQSKNRRPVVGLVIFLVVAAGLVTLFVLGATRDKGAKPTDAKAGDCVHQVGLTSVETVSCDAADADFKVVGRVEGKYQAEAQISLNTGCEQWPETTTTYWQGKQGQRGAVLCLSKLK